MEVQYQCNLDDYDEAVKAHRPVQVKLGALVILLMLVVAAEAVLGKLGFRQETITLVGLVLISASVLLTAVLRPFLVRKGFQDHPNFGREQVLRIDEDGFHSKNEVQQSDTHWRAYLGWRETRNLFVLYLGKSLFQVIPKRAFSSEELGDLRQLLQNKLRPFA